MVKSGIWGLELADGGLGVDLDFGTLTHQAYARPVLNVLVHAGPDILGGDEALHSWQLHCLAQMSQQSRANSV